MDKEQGTDPVCIGTVEGNLSGKENQGQVVKDKASQDISG